MVIDWDADDIRTALATSAASPNKDTHDFWNDLSANEVSGTGYTAWGFDHSAGSASLDASTDEVRLDLNDASWTSSSFTARYAIVLKYTGTTSTSPMAGYVDFGGDETVSSGTFSITWDATGVLKLDYT